MVSEKNGHEQVFKTIRYEKDKEEAQIVYITLNRPDKNNAISIGRAAMTQEIQIQTHADSSPGAPPRCLQDATTRRSGRHDPQPWLTTGGIR